jgi:hypothetical protein
LREARYLFERPGLFEQVSRAGDYRDLALRMHLRCGLSIEIDHDRIALAHNQQRRRVHLA